jgi:DNA-binding response OmpR family regulator
MSRIDPNLPMIVLSGRGEEVDRVRGFDRGADDYLSKPYSYPELRARLRAVLRRAQGRRASGHIRIGGLVVDPRAREVHLHGQRLALSHKEFSLLRILATDPTRVFSKGDLVRTVWGQQTLGASRTLDSHACRLRRKLGVRGERFVINVWGYGYRLLDVSEVALEDAAPRRSLRADGAGFGSERRGVVEVVA